MRFKSKLTRPARSGKAGGQHHSLYASTKRYDVPEEEHKAVDYKHERSALEKNGGRKKSRSG